ncbi:MAG: hypothetical protein U0514_00045 [Candidatus Andersenbacteria bacterium]
MATKSLRVGALVALLAAAALYGFLPQQTHAHELEESGAAGAVLHVEPNDSPVAEATSTISFVLTNHDDDFSLEDCACTLRVLQGDLQLAELSPATAEKVEHGVFNLGYTYVFPAAGAYVLELAGTRKPNATFEEFLLHYDINAVQPQAAAISSTMVWLVAGGLVLVVLVVGLVELKRRKRPSGAEPRR